MPYTVVINMNWSIKLPNSYKEIYSKNSGPSFHGDGIRYHILEYKNKGDIALSLHWKDDKNSEIETSVKNALESLNVPVIYMPNFNSNYKYYLKKKEDSSVIYSIFFPSVRKLYIVEEIH